MSLTLNAFVASSFILLNQDYDLIPHSHAMYGTYLTLLSYVAITITGSVTLVTFVMCVSACFTLCYDGVMRKEGLISFSSLLS